jgi:hypothetical protein
MPPSNRSQTVTFTPKFKHINFYLVFWASFAFCEVDCHKMQGRETLSSSHNDFNTTEENTGLTESFSTSPELRKACVGI